MAEQVQIPGAGHGQTVSRRKLERLSRASLYDEVARLEGRNAALGAELLNQWEFNHAEHCRNDYPHEGMCHWPQPAALSDTGEDWLEVREQDLKKYLLELKDRIHDRKYHASFWKDCRIEECFAIRAALAALEGQR